jgi:hypothetical protein
MSAHCISSKTVPFAFICPSCEAEYKVVTFGASSNIHHRKIGCLRCDALFPAGEGTVSLKYILMAPRRRRA